MSTYRSATICVVVFAACCLLRTQADACAQELASPYSALAAPCADDVALDPDDVQTTMRDLDLDRYVAPTDFLLDRQGESFYVASEGRKSLLRVRVDGSADHEAFQLSFRPFKLRFFPDETRVAIVGDDDRSQGRLAIVKIAERDENGANRNVPMTLVAEYAVGHGPADVVVIANDAHETLYVADRFDGTLDEFDPSNGEKGRSWNVGREPFALEATPDGRRVVVANRITDMAANRAFSCAKVYVVDLETNDVASAEARNGDNLFQDVAVSPDGKYAFVTCVRGNTLHTASGVSGGWLNANGVLCLDVEKCEIVEFFTLDSARLGAGNPWGVACSDDGEQLVVSIAGTDEIIVMPLQRAIKTASERPEWARPGYSSYAYSELPKEDKQLPFRMRAKFGLKGMRQIVVRGNDVYVLAYFDDAICKATLKLTPPFQRFVPGAYEGELETPPIALEEESTDVDARLRFVALESRKPTTGVEIERSFARLAPKPRLSVRRRGEILFHDATACRENWMSCVSCHPDARSDGLNWDLLNDGSGNAKNTKSMLLAHETPPSMVSGVRPDAETAVRAGFVHILETVATEENALAIDEFLSTMTPIPSPRLVDGKLNESATRGKTLFESDKVGCVSCHLGELHTDMRKHYVSSQEPNDSIMKFDTPSLVEVWRTAPYLNSGAYPTLRDMLEQGKHGVKKGQFDALSAQEQDDLIEYVLSL